MAPVTMYPFITTGAMTMECSDSVIIKKLFLTSCRFRRANFERLLRYLRQGPVLTHLRFTQSCLSQDQVDKLLIIVNGCLKGVKFQDERGVPFGSCYTDWHFYNQAKKNQSELRETTVEALKYFKNLPDRIMDFGAGTGQETIPLIQMGCPCVIAVDSDREATEILEGRYSKQSQDKPSKLIIYRGAFSEYVPETPVDLLICNYTWPYRAKQDFPLCWKKTKECVAEGGIIAGNFFGVPTVADPAMTYHTEAELHELLKHDFDMLFFKVEKPGSRKVYGGGIPPWGNLFHVVARKKISQSKSSSSK